MGKKLCEVIAVASGKKGSVQAKVTAQYHVLQKLELFDGLDRKYQPRTEDGDTLPPESKRPQATVAECVELVACDLRELIDLTATLDEGNTVARGEVLGCKLPVTTLLFLEKQVGDIRTFVSKIPTLDPSERWTYDDSSGAWCSEPRSTTRTRKVAKPVVLYPATEQHPAQTQMVTEDEAVGTWTQTACSTRMPAKDKAAMLRRCDELLDMIRAARERANSIEVDSVRVGENLLRHVFGTYMQ